MVDRETLIIVKSEGKSLGENLAHGLIEEFGDNAYIYPEGSMEDFEDLSIWFSEWQDSWVQTSDYANNFLPDIRALAGCKDTNRVGSYRDCTEDNMYDVEELIDAFYDAVWEGLTDTLTR